jgi:hypothetical protein
MSFGKGGGTTVQTPEMTPEQRQQVNLQNQFAQFLIPQYQALTGGATNLYNKMAPGFDQATQNLAGTANQNQNVLGTTGESAVKTGVSGLENLFGKDYEQQQLAAAMAPAQAQYAQNLQNQAAQFGGTGNLGSARQALAQAQTAGQAQAAQMQAAAQMENQIAQQRLAAGQSLAGIGQSGLQQALAAAGQGLTASSAPIDLFNKYASVLYGAPSQSYGLGPVGSNTTTNQSNFGIKI